MTKEEDLRQVAEEFAKANKKRIAKELTDTATFAPDKIPISVFMAGSPGAGKTEFSKNLIASLEENTKHKVVRIDGDELRSLIPGYTGVNSYLFQGAVSILVDKIHDLVLENNQTFLLDGTFSKHERAATNINRSLNKNRPVIIFYIYQEPEVAWKFTQAREVTEGRNIPKKAFIDQFLAARETVYQIRKEFGSRVVVMLVKKNFENHEVEQMVPIIEDEAELDHYLGERYSKSDLEKLL